MDTLIEGLKSGKEESYREFFRHYQHRLYRWLSMMVGEASVEDLMQEVLMKIATGISSYKTDENFNAWVFKIARNACCDYWRRGEKAKERAVEGLEETVATDRTPLHDVMAQETRTLLLQAVRSLPEPQREVFLLREEGDLSFKEIAGLTGCSLNTVLGRMRYALKNLRQNLIACHLNEENV